MEPIHNNFEALIADILTRFMNANGELDELVEQSLCEVGRFLGQDRLTYLDVYPEKNRLVPQWEWSSDPSTDLRIPMGKDVSGRFPWLTSRVLKGEALLFESLDQFPEVATAERQFCEDRGIRSFAFIPVAHEGKVIAAISLDYYGGAWPFDESVLQRLKFFTLIIASSHLRARALRENEQLRRFEAELSKISTAFVNLPPDDVDNRIEQGLHAVSKVLAADLVMLTRVGDGPDPRVTHEWRVEDLPHQSFKGEGFTSEFPWLSRQQLTEDALRISGLDNWPAEAAEERRVCEQMGIQSMLAVRLMIRNDVVGALTVATRQRAVWQDKLATRLQLLGEVFGEALIRQKAEIELNRSLREIEALKKRLEQENRYLRQENGLAQASGKIVGDSPALRTALLKAEQVAATDSTVLILGETGTGKELLAHAVHNLSNRRDRTLVKVNCAALPSSLVEAELFGREKGAYTGALTRELGRFEIADGSTILLDEIAELSLNLQSKLLRVLQDGEFERLGSSRTRKVNVRVLAATNRDLAQAVRNRDFREDLYYRLNVFPIELPPLRERIEDLPKLVWSFVQEFSESMGKTVDTIPVAAMEGLKSYRWPGNIRELRNIIERSMIVARGPVLDIAIPENLSAAEPPHKRLADVERAHITATVESAGWRISGTGGAAEILGLKPTTLEARMKKLGIIRPKRA